MSKTLISLFSMFMCTDLFTLFGTFLCLKKWSNDCISHFSNFGVINVKDHPDGHNGIMCQPTKRCTKSTIHPSHPQGGSTQTSASHFLISSISSTSFNSYQNYSSCFKHYNHEHLPPQIYSTYLFPISKYSGWISIFQFLKNLIPTPTFSFSNCNSDYQKKGTVKRSYL